MGLYMDVRLREHSSTQAFKRIPVYFIAKKRGIRLSRHRIPLFRNKLQFHLRDLLL